MNKRIAASSLFLLMLLVPVHTRAQFAQRGGVAGSVFDPSGAVVPGAQITLVDPGQNQNRLVKSDALGHFEFDNLTAGQDQFFRTELST